ncbi:MAG: RluA family pseudouridine synthase [Tissierellales bacterium]|nr:RluA family pseudouridine synthase [Tissierellales bacterium]
MNLIDDCISYTNEGNEVEVKDFLLSKNISNRLYCQLYRNKMIYINGEILRNNYIVSKNDTVTIYFVDEVCDIEPEKMDLDIVYEDKDLIVINKPPFMLVHPTKNYPDKTLANGVAYYFNKINLKRKIRIVNRLDRDTSGLVIFAKNQFAHQQMSLQLENGILEKYYYTIVDGIINEKDGIIEVPIAQKIDGYGREVRNDGDYCKTYYEVIDRYDDFTLLKVKTFTGRTHQIRVHMAYIGHPIIGDELYFKKDRRINRQALHAYGLIFENLRAKTKVNLKVQIPQDMANILKR